MYSPASSLASQACCSVVLCSLLCWRFTLVFLAESWFRSPDCQNSFWVSRSSSLSGQLVPAPGWGRVSAPFGSSLPVVRCLCSKKALADSDWAELKQCTGWKEPTPVHPTCLQKHTQGLFQRKLISWLQERASISPESTACAVVLTQCDQPERQVQGRAEQRASLTVQGYPSDPSKAPPLGLPLPLAWERH